MRMRTMTTTTIMITRQTTKMKMTLKGMRKMTTRMRMKTRMTTRMRMRMIDRRLPQLRNPPFDILRHHHPEYADDRLLPYKTALIHVLHTTSYPSLQHRTQPPSTQLLQPPICDGYSPEEVTGISANSTISLE